jgi:hypothetical protein
MRIMKRCLSVGLMALVLAAFTPVGAFAAEEVNVFVEGAWTQDDVELCIYADLSAAVISAGIKVTYVASKYAVASAEKNETVWFFKDEDGTMLSYMDPDTSVAGEIFIPLGHVDAQGDPLEGVDGNRVLLAKARFTRTPAADAPPEEGDFVVDLGKPAPYDNFVRASDGEVLDDNGGVTFGPDTIAERGDANASGSINIDDVTAVRNIVFGDPSRCYADCNDDGAINIDDVTCIRNKVFGIP